MIKRFAPRAVVSALLAAAGTVSAAGCAATAADTAATKAARGPAGAARAGLARTPAPAAVIVRHFVLPDGHRMTAARFTGAVRFVLHCGNADPRPPCQGKTAGPARPAPRGARSARTPGGS